MNIKTKNINKEIITAKELKDAVHFYLNMLIPNYKKRNIDLQIVMEPLMIKGYIEWMDKPYKPKQFKIALSSNYKKKYTLITLAHECVHLKQYVMGELSDITSKSKIRWKKEPILNEDKLHYYDQPWEIECHGREWGLYERFIQSLPSSYRVNKRKATGAKKPTVRSSKWSKKINKINKLPDFEPGLMSFN